MDTITLSLLLFSTSLTYGLKSAPFYFPNSVPLNPNIDYGEPLFLTPLIDAGDFVKARNLSRVGPLLNAPINYESYSGYLTVNKTYNSNLFFWYFPAFNNSENAPTFVWLQGGPGWSSMYGIFMESGPYAIYDQEKVKLRRYTWSRKFNVIYIDNPVGTGFSFTDSPEGYNTRLEEVTVNLYDAVKQIFKIFEELKNNEFYVAGESYGGKYVTSLAYQIHQMKPANIKFAGLFCGNPALDNANSSDIGEILYTIGMVNEKQLHHFRRIQLLSDKLLADGNEIEALRLKLSLYGGLPENEPTYFTNVTGFCSNTNFLYPVDPGDVITYEHYLSLQEVRKAIHVGAQEFHSGREVAHRMRFDIGTTVTTSFGELMNEYKTMLYYGQLDLLFPYRPSEKMLRDMTTWNRSSEYLNAEKIIWKTGPGLDDIGGYVISVGEFKHVLVRNAGHMVPFYQPKSAYDMIDRFINNKSFK